MHFPRVGGACERFVGVFGTQTFSSDSQLNLSCVVNSKKRGEFATTPTTRTRLVRFAAGWADNLHRAFRGFETDREETRVRSPLYARRYTNLRGKK
jgi:hypothetical protein